MPRCPFSFLRPNSLFEQSKSSKEAQERGTEGGLKDEKGLSLVVVFVMEFLSGVLED
ncbi:hypothetical protein PanWU01x14_111030 [Parasponia andersonii]|uniref:Uncharacterized protein n=1 Tax=Parasponia andersonii TaxID=3476 RepID=A0A2P5CYY4_PARAD|nr:hypothetical protein PanWU01x14_111030 [Parasponia andersonii]